MHCTNLNETSELTSVPPRLSLIEGLPCCTVQNSILQNYSANNSKSRSHFVMITSFEKKFEASSVNIKETSKVIFMTLRRSLTEGLPSCTVQI